MRPTCRTKLEEMKMGVMSEIPGTALTPVQNEHLDWLEA